ncbi:MAG TPA: hypothetical protein VEF34_00560 [Syntrophobacteraceae bacterium]|nr:hypothetical protein [Syntrophobacteraceae bacterium]
MLSNWSTREVAWFSGLVLVLIICLIYRTNRLTLQRAVPASRGLGPTLCLSGLFLLIWGTKLNLIHDFGSDIPFWDQWGLEAPLISSVLKGTLHPSELFDPASEHRPLIMRLLDIMLLKLNGQWDPIVQMFVSSILYSLVLTGLCLVIWRLAGRKNLPLFCLAIGIIGVRHFSWETVLWGSTVGFILLPAFSFIAIVLLLYSKPFSADWHLGLAATLLGQFSIGSGFLAPFAVACVMVFNRISGTLKSKESRFAVFVLVAAAILEFLMTSVSPGAILKKFDPIGTLKVFGNIAAWPALWWGLAPLFWFPFFLLIRRQLRTGRSSDLTQFLLAVGTWALLEAASMAWYRGGSAVRYKDIHAAGLLVNLIIVFYLSAGRGLLADDRYRRAILAGSFALVLLTAMSVFHFNEMGIIVERHRLSEIEEVNTARYILTGDPSSLINQPPMHIPYTSSDGLIPLLEDPVVRNVFPAGIRAPLRLDPAEGPGFSAGGIPPELPALPHRKVLGSWRRNKGISNCEYLSGPISTSYSRLVFDIAGGAPGASLEILPSEGRAIPVYAGGRSSRWKQVAVKAPRVPFRLHARDRSEHGWIAFSWPRELAGGGYYVRQICSANLAIAAFGLVILIAGLTAIRSQRLETDK